MADKQKNNEQGKTELKRRPSNSKVGRFGGAFKKGENSRPTRG
jgi:hypothetical protein